MIKYEEKCIVSNEDRKVDVEVEIDDYRAGKGFMAYLSGAKFKMRYNPSLSTYEGRVAGMDLSSKGPRVWKL